MFQEELDRAQRAASRQRDYENRMRQLEQRRADRQRQRRTNARLAREEQQLAQQAHVSICAHTFVVFVRFSFPTLCCAAQYVARDRR